MVEVFIKEVECHPETLQMLTEWKELRIEKQQASNNLH